MVRVLRAHLVLVDHKTIDRPLRLIDPAIVQQAIQRVKARLRERNLPGVAGECVRLVVRVKGFLACGLSALQAAKLISDGKLFRQMTLRTLALRGLVL